MTYLIRHLTRYDYSETVPICYNRAHLSPRNDGHQRVLDKQLQVTPSSALFSEPRTDFFGNELTYFTVQEPHSSMEVTLHAQVDVDPVEYLDLNESLPWEDAVQASQETGHIDAYRFAFDSRFVGASAVLRAYAVPSFPAGRPLLAAVSDLTARIYRDFTYDPAATTVSTPLDEVMQNRRGVCQDFAHLEIGCLRSVGVPARYVSGYIYGGDVNGEPNLTGAQASHAWLSVFCPKFGWVDFDPTNNMIPSDLHITLAWGRDYDDVSPVRGVVLGGGEHTISVEVQIARA
ncbi:MAG: transglutaminase family protein [Candidatus Hydrogenedentes bacterium]|nr:transglutaminase family protein [Candidatus Hydrogenedentota bacterium]